jgi:hypothetical protein
MSRMRSGMTVWYIRFIATVSSTKCVDRPTVAGRSALDREMAGGPFGVLKVLYSDHEFYARANFFLGDSSGK